MQKFYLILLLSVFALKAMEQEESTTKMEVEAEKEMVLSAGTPISAVLEYAYELAQLSDILPDLDVYSARIAEINRLTIHIKTLLQQPISDYDKERLNIVYKNLATLLRDLNAKSAFLTDQLARGWHRGMVYQPNEQNFSNAFVPNHLIQLIMDIYKRVDTINVALSKVTDATSLDRAQLLYEKLRDSYQLITLVITLLTSEVENTAIQAKKGILQNTIGHFERLLKENLFAQAYLRSKFSDLKGEQ